MILLDSAEIYWRVYFMVSCIDFLYSEILYNPGIFSINRVDPGSTVSTPLGSSMETSKIIVHAARDKKGFVEKIFLKLFKPYQ